MLTEPGDEMGMGSCDEFGIGIVEPSLLANMIVSFITSAFIN